MSARQAKRMPFAVVGFSVALTARPRRPNAARGRLLPRASDGTEVLASRPAPHEAPIDDVNWFARRA
jgi:hypothetical protein